MLTFAFAIFAETFLTIYVFPFSTDRYGMMELTNKGDKIGWIIVDLFCDASILCFMFYFTIYLRFTLVHKNLDRKDILFKSVFSGGDLHKGEI